MVDLVALIFYGIFACFTQADSSMPRDKERIKPDFLDDPEIQGTIEDILHPYLSKKEAVVSLQFGVPREKADLWREAVQFASSQAGYASAKVGRFTRHRVEFRPDQAKEIFQMYRLVENSPHLEIFINNQKLPYAATLWLPLLWFYL
jgi:hypothetical protein